VKIIKARLLMVLMLTLSACLVGCAGQEQMNLSESESAEPSAISESKESVEPSASGTEEASESMYFVATDGDDSNPGTLEAPLKTIQKAADIVKPGDVVYVRGGTYNEKVVIKTSGSDGVFITFENYKGETPVIDGEGLVVGEDDEENGLIVVKDKSFIKIKGFDVTNYVSTSEYVPAGIRIIGAGQHIEILNCRVHGIKTTYTDAAEEDRNAHGIAVHGTNGEASLDSIIIDGCEVYDNVLGWSESVVLNGNVTNFRVTNNKVHDNDNIGIDFIGFEDTAPSNDQARDGICSGNEVWNISSANNDAYNETCADGIYVDGGKNIIIEGNKVWNCDIGIEAASEHAGRTTENITIRNNLIYGCKEVAGIAFGGYDEERGSADNIKIYNNTLYDNEPNILIQFYCQYETNVIKNNIIYKGSVFDCNIGDITVSNNITEDPKFASEETNDFHLASDSPAVDAGVNDELIGHFDLDKNDRVSGSSVDCGAFEAKQ